ncbi:MAG: hypothetical protein CVU33_05055 [Betaproteobacteria bacterium HGW-Betaproteobacteria-6]|nr:MAG: hypothetical protein CVU33_05055 [Betaproteobacteria bacterium HGW-Betaproteobacteria-6]
MSAKQQAIKRLSGRFFVAVIRLVFPVGITDAWEIVSRTSFDEVIMMLEPETLVALGCIAILPYVGEAIWNWLRNKSKH